MQRAVGLRDWRYVTAIAVQCLQLHVHDPRRLLHALGLSDWGLLGDRAERVSAIRTLLGDPLWDRAVLDTVITAFSALCRLVVGVGVGVVGVVDGPPSSSSSSSPRICWTLPLDTMEDFDHHTRLVQTDLVANFQAFLSEREGGGDGQENGKGEGGGEGDLRDLRGRGVGEGGGEGDFPDLRGRGRVVGEGDGEGDLRDLRGRGRGVGEGDLRDLRVWGVGEGEGDFPDLRGRGRGVGEGDEEGDLRELCEHVLNRRTLFFLRALASSGRLTRDQAKRGLWVAHEEEDWPTFLTCLRCRLDLSDEFIEGESVVQIALRQSGGFQLLPRDIPARGVNWRDARGLTLLHTAVARWQEGHSGGILRRNILNLLASRADVTLPYPDGQTVLQKIVDKSKASRGDRRLVLLRAAVSSAARAGRAVDWTPVPGSQWSALHVLVDEGDRAGIPRLLQLGADPLGHRRGLTLIDTALLARAPSVRTKRELLQTLSEIPGVVRDHVKTVRERSPSSFSSSSSSSSSSSVVEEDFRYAFPMMHLLHATKADPSNFELIKTLGLLEGFAEVELREAVTESSLSTLRERGLGEVVAYLEKAASLRNGKDQENA